VRRLSLVCLVLALVVRPLAAQNYREVPDYSMPRLLLGLTLQTAFPQGEFANFVGTGFGVGGNVTVMLDSGRRLGVRLYGSWIEYGRSTERVPYPGLPGISVDLTTANDIYSFGAGPEVHLGAGRFRPYLDATIGLSNFATTTSAKGSGNSNPFAKTTNFNDWTAAFYGGGGLLFQVSSGRNPVWIDGGVRYQTHGQTRYLREGSLQPAPGGGVVIQPIESKTDLLVVNLGVQIGI
jgi:hypothetical protein